MPVRPARSAPSRSSPGPGVLNATAALSTSYASNAPVLCLTGQIASALIGRGVGLLHEIPDQLAMRRGLTKWAVRADHPSEAPDWCARRFRQLGQGRVRPVAIEMAMDVMALEAHVPLLEPLEAEAPLEPDAKRIAEAAALLGQARKSAIFVGGGVFGAEEEVTALAAMLEAPVVMSGYGQGAISDRHYLAQRYQAGHRLWAEADVVLAMATRLQPPLFRLGHRRRPQDHPPRHRSSRDHTGLEARHRHRRRCAGRAEGLDRLSWRPGSAGGLPQGRDGSPPVRSPTRIRKAQPADPLCPGITRGAAR